MTREIKCSLCAAAQPQGKDFFRIRPQPLMPAKTLCDECLAEIGGKQAAEDWLMNAYAK